MNAAMSAFMQSGGRYVSIGLFLSSAFTCGVGCDSSETTDSPDSSVEPAADAAPTDSGVKHDAEGPHDAGPVVDAAGDADAAKEPEAGLDGGPNHASLCPATAKTRATAAIKELHDHWFVSG